MHNIPKRPDASPEKKTVARVPTLHPSWRPFPSTVVRHVRACCRVLSTVSVGRATCGTAKPRAESSSTGDRVQPPRRVLTTRVRPASVGGGRGRPKADPLPGQNLPTISRVRIRTRPPGRRTGGTVAASRRWPSHGGPLGDTSRRHQAVERSAPSQSHRARVTLRRGGHICGPLPVRPAELRASHPARGTERSQAVLREVTSRGAIALRWHPHHRGSGDLPDLHPSHRGGVTALGALLPGDLIACKAPLISSRRWPAPSLTPTSITLGKGECCTDSDISLCRIGHEGAESSSVESSWVGVPEATFGAGRRAVARLERPTVGMGLQWSRTSVRCRASRS